MIIASLTGSTATGPPRRTRTPAILPLSSSDKPTALDTAECSLPRMAGRLLRRLVVAPYAVAVHIPIEVI